MKFLLLCQAQQITYLFAYSRLNSSLHLMIYISDQFIIESFFHFHIKATIKNFLFFLSSAVLSLSSFDVAPDHWLCQLDDKDLSSLFLTMRSKSRLSIISFERQIFKVIFLLCLPSLLIDLLLDYFHLVFKFLSYSFLRTHLSDFDVDVVLSNEWCQRTF